MDADIFFQERSCEWNQYFGNSVTQCVFSQTCLKKTTFYLYVIGEKCGMIIKYKVEGYGEWNSTIKKGSKTLLTGFAEDFSLDKKKKKKKSAEKRRWKRIFLVK